MGRIVAPYGVKGWVRVQPFTQQPHALLDYAEWLLGNDGTWVPRVVQEARVHGASVVARLAEAADREHALALRGLRIAVRRERLPEVRANEYYWADLIDLAVVNTEGVEFGTVARVFETGANDVLVVDGERERLLPFISPVIRQVDIAGGRIVVDWDADF